MRLLNLKTFFQENYIINKADLDYLLKRIKLIGYYIFKILSKIINVYIDLSYVFFVWKKNHNYNSTY